MKATEKLSVSQARRASDVRWRRRETGAVARQDSPRGRSGNGFPRKLWNMQPPLTKEVPGVSLSLPQDIFSERKIREPCGMSFLPLISDSEVWTKLHLGSLPGQRFWEKQASLTFTLSQSISRLPAQAWRSRQHPVGLESSGAGSTGLTAANIPDYSLNIWAADLRWTHRVYVLQSAQTWATCVQMSMF